MSGNDTGDGDAQMQKFELYIKASAIDKETKGSCPICQQFFMITCLLGENQDDIDFKVFTVQADCPPKNFASGWSKKYPVVMVNSGRNKAGQDISGMMYDTFEDLEIFFASINKECPELKSANAPNQSAMAVVGNLYKYFNHFIAGQPEKALVGELRKLNEYLESQDTKFMVDNVLSFSDCHLLPRLQHIRVAGKAYRDFDIPKEFTYIWRYLKNAYEQDAFKSTMPSDQDIIKNYEKKACNVPKVKSKGNPTLEKFTYLMDVPEDILETIYNGTSASSDGGATQVEEAEVAPVPEPTPEVEPEQREPSPEPEPPVEAEQEPEAAPVEQQQQEEPEAAPVEQQPQQQEEEELEPTAAEQHQEPEPTAVEPSEEPQTGGTGDGGLEETSITTTTTEGTDTTEKIASSAPNGDVQGQVEAAQ
ncbi:chloride intracellular channel [Plakobranchus ocellatus]|uniref:Chloride intracellular channel n=1 Tax=Plakobranchus ocellatus TaxID=259542 RepID=A0AAV4AA03_9GAST|nr:chloride intracellular channel [Plakobranchus ocellatus]